MQLQHVPRLEGPASGSGRHSAAGLATVSGGAFTRTEVTGSYTEPMKRFSSASTAARWAFRIRRRGSMWDDGRSDLPSVAVFARSNADDRRVAWLTQFR